MSEDGSYLRQPVEPLRGMVSSVGEALPARSSPEDVAAYIEDRSEAGARPSTLRTVAAAIAPQSQGRRFRGEEEGEGPVRQETEGGGGWA